MERGQTAEAQQVFNVTPRYVYNPLVIPKTGLNLFTSNEKK